MTIVQYGKWKIAVDVEKTKEYYRDYVIDENQMHRNFAEYCKSMSAEEREFFDSFGINPECCEVTHLGVSKKKEAPCGGYYLICGKYLEHPPEVLITADEFAANNFECDIEDPRIQIGIFQFDIVAWLFGGQTAGFSRIIYAVVGLAGLWCITLLFRRGRAHDA